MSARVLCFAPYSNYHPLHGMWEMTVLHGLALRGAKVRYVLCDGLGELCDLFRLEPEKKSCSDCRAKSVGLATSMGMEYSWLGGYLAPDARDKAEAWVEGLAGEDLFEAQYGSWELGKWIRSSLHTYLRMEKLDAADPEVVRVCRLYLGQALLVAWGMERLLRDFRPDVLFLFNGRLVMVRVAMELAMLRGVRVVTHERGMRKEALGLGRNDIPMGVDRFHDIWENWGGVPLTAGECAGVRRFLQRRAGGRDDNWRSYSPAAKGLQALRGHIPLAEGEKLFVIYTSSNDELADCVEYKQGAFAEQDEWLAASLHVLKRFSGVRVVVRVHPNVGGEKSFGVCRDALQSILRLRAAFPEAHFVMPDDEVSSYDLMRAAHAGIVFASTMGLEMAARGKAVVQGGFSYYGMCPAVLSPATPAEYLRVLHEFAAMEPGYPPLRDAMRSAYRYFHGVYVDGDIPFPLVRMPTPFTGELAYSSTRDLRPGLDPGLDHACDVILHDAPILLPPGQRPADQSGEDAFFDSLAVGDNDLVS